MVVNKMKRAYIIEFGGEKEVDEMNALELNNIDSATLWIRDSMQSDEEYFNIELVSGMNDIKFYCYMNLIKICLIMFWCENVNSFLEGKERGLRISRQNVLDFHKFKEKKSELGEQLNKIETL